MEEIYNLKPEFLVNAIDRVNSNYSNRTDRQLSRIRLRTYLKKFVDEVMDDIEREVGGTITLTNQNDLTLFRSGVAEMAEALEDDSDD